MKQRPLSLKISITSGSQENKCQSNGKMTERDLSQDNMIKIGYIGVVTFVLTIHEPLMVSNISNYTIGP